MKIAVDSGPLRSGDSVRGIGVYTRELLSALGISGVDVFRFDLSKYTVVHFTRFNSFRVSLPYSKPKKTKFVLTIYDLIPLIYPDHYPAGIRGKINWFINKYLIRKNIDAIITISETSKKDICRFIGIKPSKVHVVYLAPRNTFRPIINHKSLIIAQKKFNLPNSFALYVGDINYNKNIPLLLEACRIAKIPLVIAGSQAKEIENMDLDHPELAHLKGLDWSGTIRLGFVEDGDLTKIYSLASVYIQPSLYEGFGLPVLEAQSVGVPVVASKTQALVEIAEGSAVFADPKSADDFAEKIKTVLKDVSFRKRIVDEGIKNAKKYKWEITAQETLRIYNEK